MNCLNCQAELTENYKFCSNCGQNTSTSRLKISDVVHHFFHAFTHADKGFVYLAKALFLQPGLIAKQYTNGKRKDIYNPFSYLLIIVAVNFFLINTFHLLDPVNVSHRNPVSEFITKHVNLMILLMVPINSLYTWLLFKKHKINYAEAIVLTAFTSGQRSLFMTLVITPILYILKGDHFFTVIYSYAGIYMLYYGFACMQFVNCYKLGAYLKGALSFLLAQITITVLISIGIFAYYKLR